MTTQQQDFNAEVGQVIQAETVTQVHHDQGRLLTPQERTELHKQVKQLDQDYGIPTWETWKFLHKTIGVPKVKFMCIGHRDSAHAIVGLMLELAEAKRRSGEGRVQNEDTAGELAKMLSQNADLTAKLAESQTHIRLFQKALNEEKKCAAELLSLLEKKKAAEGKTETMLRNAAGRCKQLEKSTADAEARARRRVWFALAFAGVAVTAATTAWFQYKKAQTLEARAGFCVFERRLYPAGSVLDRALDLECVKTTDGQALWQVYKPRRK